ncbi:hypothetical protein [Sphingobacterium siyangense]|uniref:hypothetical protein n=1 Tax=Sphingobacterium siyangense TaxID=459529 RepID=UPI002FDA29BB
MKTVLKIICLLLFLIAQQSQAQTKEETIKWIKEKLEKYNVDVVKKNFKMESISITPCNIELYVSYYNELYEKIVYTTHSFPTNPISFDDLNIWFKSNVVRYEINVDADGDGKNDVHFVKHVPFIGDKENNLCERMAKALQHLNTFCEKKKETF